MKRKPNDNDRWKDVLKELKREAQGNWNQYERLINNLSADGVAITKFRTAMQSYEHALCIVERHINSTK